MIQNHNINHSGSLNLAEENTIACANSIRWVAAEAGIDLMTQVPSGFVDLFELRGSLQSDLALDKIKSLLNEHLSRRNFDYKAKPLNFSDPMLPHAKIYGGVNYYDKGPVIVNPKHMKLLFDNFEIPTSEEIASRVQVAKDVYGTMPGIEAAYTAAIVKSVKPRTIFIIGEHRGMLTSYLANNAPSDCLIFTLDLSRQHYEREQVAIPDAINKNFVNYEQHQIGEAWRSSSFPYRHRILGFLGDSTHSDLSLFFDALAGSMDLIIVDGSHEYHQVCIDLKTANKISSGGPIIVDDFWKQPRLFEVTEAALHMRREIGEKLKYLHHLSWGFGGEDEKIVSNLGFFLGE